MEFSWIGSVGEGPPLPCLCVSVYICQEGQPEKPSFWLTGRKTKETAANNSCTNRPVHCVLKVIFFSFITLMKFCNRVRHCCFVFKPTCFARDSIRPRMRRSLQSLNASLSMCETLPLPSLRESKYRERRDHPSPVWSFMRRWLADGGRPEQITPSYGNLDRDADFC